MKSILFCIEIDGCTYLYKVTLRRSIYDLLRSLNNTYSIREDGRTFRNVPLINGRLSLTKIENNLDAKIYGYNIIEKTFISRTRQGNNEIIRQSQKRDIIMEANIKGNIRYNSKIERIVEDLFGERDQRGIVLMNFTDLMKLYNQINGKPNNFIYDKTIDTPMRIGYPNEKVYYEGTLNSPLGLNYRENQLNFGDYKKLIEDITKGLDISFLGYFENEENLGQEFEILKAFGERNKSIFNFVPFKPFLRSLKQVKRTQVDNTLVDQICELPNYYYTNQISHTTDIGQKIRRTTLYN